MAKSEFMYVTFIRTTPEELWKALLEPEFTRQYWMGTVQQCDWTVGSTWKRVFEDGRMTDSGEVVEIDPPRKLVLTWKHELFPDMIGEGYSRMTYELQPKGEMVKLTLVHAIDKPESKLIKGVSGGWPIILSSLKSFLETGAPLEGTSSMPKGI
jgi:uncharacterized protein YndB with AHSA1/START domain